jgi:hypothetical protein
MKNILKRFFFYLILLTSLIINASSGDPCPLATLANDLSTSSIEFKTLVKETDGFNAWLVLNKEAPTLRTNIEELKLVSKNLNEISKAGGYLKWKTLNLNFTSLIKSNLTALGVTDDVNKYLLVPNSKGGAYFLEGVSIESKEITNADEVFVLTGQKCIFPQTNLQAIEGFLENGTPFTMKQIENSFTNFVTRINDMYTSIKKDPNFQWVGAEGYLKIAFSTFVKSTKDGNSIEQVTQSYVEQQFKAGIGKGGFLIKNDGTVKNITVFLQDGTTFKLDLTKLKP